MRRHCWQVDYSTGVSLAIKYQLEELSTLYPFEEDSLSTTKNTSTTTINTKKVTMNTNTTTVSTNPDGSLDLTVTPADKVAITIRNANESPLLRLPAEVRNRIFKYVYEDEVHHIDQPTCYYYLIRYRYYMENLFSLPHVCRQLYSETLQLPFRLTTIRIHCDSHEYRRVLRRFAGHLFPWQKNAIQKITVHLDEGKDEWQITVRSLDGF